MKALRILGIVSGVVLALVAVLLGTLYALFDGEKLKAELTRVVMEQKQRKLEIVGPLELSVWPDVGIKLGRLTLSEPGGKEEFLALDAARVAVAVMPLLSKQVQVQRIEIDGLKATLVKRKDGTLNIADLAGGAADKEDAAKAAPKVPEGTHSAGAGDTAAPVQIDIAGIKIANAQLIWRDEKSKQTTTLSRLDLGSGRVQADSGRQTLAVDALALATKGKTGADSFELKLDVPRLNIAPDKSSGETLNLTANLAGSGRTLAAKLVLSGIEGNVKALKIGKLALDLDAKAGESTLKARIDSPVAADIAAQTVALEKLAGSIDLANPQMPMKQLKLPLSGSLRADLAKQSAALDLGTKFDESKIALKLKVARFAPLALGFDLDIDTLDVDKYMPPKKAEEKAAADPTAAGKAGSEGKDAADTLDFSALKGHDVNGALRIGRLQVSKLKLAKLDARIKLAGGRLDVAPLSMNLYEGSASGSLSLNAAGNQLGLRQNLTGISINPLLKDLADKDLLEGRGNVALDLTSRGDSVAALKQALAGTASLSLRDGAIKGINLAQSMRDIKAKLGTLQGKPQGTTQKAKAGEKTDFSELTVSLKIANGVARNDDLAMKSPFLRLAGAGEIDIGAGRMDYLAKATLVNTSTGQGGKEADKVKGFTVPLRIAGPFEALTYTPELGDLAAEMARSKLEDKAGAITGKGESKLKDKLKGLLGK